MSQKFGFTGLYKEEFARLKEAKRLVSSGSTVAVIKEKGNIESFLSKVSRAL